MQRVRRLMYQACRDGLHQFCPGRAPERAGRVLIRASECTCKCHRAPAPAPEEAGLLLPATGAAPLPEGEEA